jgi:hypothetical protein
MRPAAPGGAGGPGGKPRKVAGLLWGGLDGGPGYDNGGPERDAAAPAAAGHGVERANSAAPAGATPRRRPAAAAGSAAAGPAAAPLTRRGRLKNGNPAGDYLAAPRCGARTRAGGGGRQPAMANGRCRLHGGKSTGPRSAAGLARSRAARRNHGACSAEIIDLRRAAAAPSAASRPSSPP